MPKSKPTSGKQWGSKSAFVRSLPKTVSAKDVVKQASEAGMKLSVAQVYNIRSTAKLKKKAVSKTPREATAPGAVARAAKSSSPAGNVSSADGQLRKLVAEVGLVRARQIMAEVSAAFAG
jgi:hypothetical protein